MNVKKQFKDGLITQNPVLVQLLGMCSTMAITTTLFNGVGMGLSVLIILTCCNIAISALRKIIPNDIRIAIYVVVIAGFVTIVDLMLKAYIPALSEALGVFIPLIVVNCIIIGRAEAFAAKNSIGAREGEKVIIQSKSSEIIGAAFLLYIVPLAVLLIGYLLIAQTGAPESTCIAGAFAAFAVAVAVVTIYQRQRTKKKQIEFEIIAYNLNE